MVRSSRTSANRAFTQGSLTFVLSHSVRRIVYLHRRIRAFTQRPAHRVFAQEDSCFHTDAFVFSHREDSESAWKIKRFAGANHGLTQTLTLFNTTPGQENDQAGSCPTRTVGSKGSCEVVTSIQGLRGS
jgi:hypothetical protein